MNQASDDTRAGFDVPHSQSTGRRLIALRALWCHRRSWRLPAGRTALRNERDVEITELMPFVLLSAALSGAGLFVLLPLTLGSQAALVVQQVWPWITVFVAPWACATLMAWLSAPNLALRLSAFSATGTPHDKPDVISAQAASHCVPVLLAHAVVATAATALLLLFTLVLGLAFNLMLHAGDLGDLASIAFTATTPMQWMQVWCHGAILGFAGMLGTVLYAWPGTQSVKKGLDAHRLGLRATLASMLASSCTTTLLLSFHMFLTAGHRIY